jgi:hypothetical protein
MRNQILRFFILCTATAACGTTATTATLVQVAPMASAASSVDYLPAESLGLIRVDVASAIRSPYYQSFRERTLRAAEEESRGESAYVVRREQLLNFVEQIDTILVSIGLEDVSDPESLSSRAAVIEGRFTLAQAAEAVALLGDGQGAQPITLASMNALRLSSATLVDLGGGRFLLAPNELAESLASAPPRSGFSSTPAFESAREHIDGQAVLSAILVPNEPIQDVLREWFGPEVGCCVQALGLSLDAGDGLEVRGAAAVSEVRAAQILEVKFNEMRDEALASSGGGMDFGLTEPLRRMRIAQDGSSMSVATEIEDREVRNLIAEAFGMFEELIRDAMAPPAFAPAPVGEPVSR